MIEQVAEDMERYIYIAREMMRVYAGNPYQRKGGLEWNMNCMKIAVKKLPDLRESDLGRSWLQEYAVVEAQWRASMYEVLRDRHNLRAEEQEEWLDTQWKQFIS